MSDPPAILPRTEPSAQRRCARAGMPGGEPMTVIDFRKHWEARRRAEWQDSEAREMGEVRRALDAWTPLIEEVIEAEKAYARLPRCEGRRCRERTASVHPVGPSSGGASVLVS